MSRYDQLVGVRAEALRRSDPIALEYRTFARSVLKGLIANFEIPPQRWSYVRLGGDDKKVEPALTFDAASGFNATVNSRSALRWSLTRPRGSFFCSSFKGPARVGRSG